MEKYAFLFPGQGSHYIGMAKSFYEESPIARQTFEEANDVLGLSLTDLCFSGSITELNRAQNMQPALLTACTAIYRAFVAQTGVKPGFSAGHSLGEYAAIVCAGALAFSDAVRMIRRRGELTQVMADQGKGTMSILDQVDPKTVATWCTEYSDPDNYAAISCFNSPNQVAVSGHQEAIEKVEQAVLIAGGQSTPLISSPPMHCGLMEEVAGTLLTEFERLPIHPFRYPVIANATSMPYGPFGGIAHRLSMQLCQPVQWESTMRYLSMQGVSCFIEIGPKNVLGKLTENIVPSAKAYSVGHSAEKKELYDRKASEPKRRPLPSFFSLCMGAIASTPNLRKTEAAQTTDNSTTAMDWLRDMDSNAPKEGLSLACMSEALQLLSDVLRYKGIGKENILDIVENIITETNQYYALRSVLNDIV